MNRNGEPPRQVVVGIGNPDRGDDGAGRIVARLLREASLPGIAVIKHDGEATGVLSKLKGAVSAYLIDASCSDATAGTVRRFDVGTSPLPHEALGSSSHGLGVAAAVEFGRALEALPPRCIVYVIEGESFELGASLSPPVKVAVADLVRHLAEEIGTKSR
jgi:hydrogenase maturation protease